jgi:hypothetical protein
VASFATDQVLSETDLTLIVAAQQGDRAALRQVCQRFQTPLLAMALKLTRSFDAAVAAVEPMLTTLCQELLLSRFLPVEFAMRALSLSRAIVSPGDEAEDARQGLDGYGAIPRVVKRRAIRQLLPEMPLPELTALLLKHLDRMPPADMVGLVADSLVDVELCLIAAHEMVQRRLDSHAGAKEPV